LIQPEKAKPAARRRRKAKDLSGKSRQPGCLEKAVRFLLFSKDTAMNRKILPMIISSRLLVFSYLKYLAHDPTHF
jgi:hypothetical protein